MTGDVFPCALRREDCLVGAQLSRRMMLDARRSGSSATPTAEATTDSSSTRPSTQLDNTALDHGEATTSTRHDSRSSRSIDDDDAPLSDLESIIITCPPIFEVLLLHLPTLSLLGLYHTSRPLRSFLRSYPLAWKTLSFRQLPNDLHTLVPSSGSQSPDAISGTSRPNALDLLFRVILPFGTRLTRLDLDNTAVSGSELYARILDGRRATLQHLSVRNCKNVSLKYHLLPFLQVQLSVPRASFNEPPLALKSLYTYRCRHHRRRPYLPSSLSRRDSESHPTHQFVQTCYALGIWTDTGWCTTPGPRCFRRRDYALGRLAADSKAEIWVPFDRLWRSQNIIGRCDLPEISKSHASSSAARVAPVKSTSTSAPRVARNGRLWEAQEYGYCGEALGAGLSTPGEGKEVPGHLRKSHTTFVEDFECHSCGDKIQERCEECSIRMHCVGCRKTLCASCAFDKPVRTERRKDTHRNAAVRALTSLGAADVPPPLTSGDVESKMNRRTGTRLWWAPGATRSPNKISEVSSDDEDYSDHDGQGSADQHGNNPLRPADPQIVTKWCCQRLDISGGSGVSSLDIFHKGTSVRAAPLPAGQGFEDPSFPSAIEASCVSGSKVIESDEDDSYPLYVRPSSNPNSDNVRGPWKTRKIQPFSVVPYIEHAAREGGSSYSTKTFPRNLCKPCYQSSGWKVRCAFKECQVGLCIEHDIKTLQVRQCGLRRLSAERRALRGAPPMRYFYAKWRPIAQDLQKHNFKWPRGAQSCSIPISGVKNGLVSSDPPSPRLAASQKLSKKASGQEGAPSQRLNHITPARPRSRSVSRCCNLASEALKSPASNYSSRDDTAISTPLAKRAHLHLNSIHRAQGFIGCSRLFCMAPDDRLPSDARPNCPCWEYLAKCRECGVYACFDCAGLEMGCPCSACSPDLRSFQCPGCRGDWKTGEQVKHATQALIARGERWKAEDRSHRFWRCRLEAETQAGRDAEAPPGKTELQTERERGALFSELRGRAASQRQ